jgi:FkbH-like protein
VGIRELIDDADALARTERLDAALNLYLDAAQAEEIPKGELCVKIARAYEGLGETAAAWAWLSRVPDAPDDFVAWAAGAGLLARLGEAAAPPASRSARIALTSSYTITQFTGSLRLAALRRGIWLDVFEGQYGQYRQDLLSPESELYAFDPDYVVLAVDERALELPALSEAPDDDISREVARWHALWRHAEESVGAAVIQHNFVLRPDPPLGHLTIRLGGSRYSMAQAVNARLGATAADGVAVVDCDRIAAAFGKDRWFDDRYWYRSKQAVALDALPTLARHTAAILAASMGLSRKCLVLDLDNTLWGGIVGEDGLAGIRLGGTATGEAFVDLQEYILALKQKGIVLAIASKNNEADVREVFDRHPDMRIRMDDIAVFLANWEDKPTNLRTIAEALDIGLDSLVFADDNPAERELVRRVLPQVDVVALPTDAADLRRTLANYVGFETPALTAEDHERTTQYRARAEVARLKASASDIEDFYMSLAMTAVVAPFDDLHLPRIVQLIGKTNQFNLTTRRYTAAEVRKLMDDPDCVHRYLKLRDRFADHGLVALLIAHRAADVLDIDTWLMSCRVIGRTVEDALLAHLCQRAHELGCSKLRGTYIPSPKNQLVRSVYERFGFRLLADEEGATIWEYDLSVQPPITNEFIVEAADVDGSP